MDEFIIPEAASGLGLKAQNRYLKAKVRVLVEENMKLNSEVNNCGVEITQLKGRLKTLENDRNRLHRVTTTHLTQLEKTKTSLKEIRSQCDVLEADKNHFKKEYETVKRTKDQQVVEIKTLNTRLNRAVEDAERYKSELDKIRTGSKEKSDTLRHDIDQLRTENCRLEKQKAELIAAFQKQMKLIDILRRQKMLIEASKCLQITEEEFLKSLDWKNG